jgi:uncharacterized membrane protein
MGTSCSSLSSLSSLDFLLLSLYPFLWFDLKLLKGWLITQYIVCIGNGSWILIIDPYLALSALLKYMKARNHLYVSL